MRGKFITFEGSEGSGKSTQAKLLKAYLKRRGYRVISLREPGGTKINEKIRKILLDTSNASISPICEMLLYMAARAQIVRDVIKPALAEGKIVLCDRFLDSTLAYQGYGLGLDIRLIKFVGRLVTQSVKPDLTILLDVPLKKGLSYRASKDRIERRPLTYHSRVRKGYFRLAAVEPKRIKVVRVEEEKEETQSHIRRITDRFLGIKAVK